MWAGRVYIVASVTVSGKFAVGIGAFANLQNLR